MAFRKSSALPPFSQIRLSFPEKIRRSFLPPGLRSKHGAVRCRRGRCRAFFSCRPPLFFLPFPCARDDHAAAQESYESPSSSEGGPRRGFRVGRPLILFFFFWIRTLLPLCSPYCAGPSRLEIKSRGFHLSICFRMQPIRDNAFPPAWAIFLFFFFRDRNDINFSAWICSVRGGQGLPDSPPCLAACRTLQPPPLYEGPADRLA